MKGTKAVYNEVKSFNLNGTIAAYSGTSFSTPRVTAFAADLMNTIAVVLN